MMSSSVALMRAKEPLCLYDHSLLPLGDFEVYVRVEACGLGLADWNVAVRDALPRVPLVIGQEAVGRVQVVGKGVKHLSIGSRVGITPLSTTCEACDACNGGQLQYCAHALFHGFNVDGAMCDVGLFVADQLIPAPDVLSGAELAPLFGSGWTAMGALRAAGVKDGMRVVIVGVGGVGHLAVQYAKHLGAAVAVVDPDKDRANFGIEVGAQMMLDAVSVSKSLKNVWDGFDVALVCTPSIQAITQACRAVGPVGTVMLLGSAPTSRVDLPLRELVDRGITVRGSFLGTLSDLQEVIALARSGVVVPTVERHPMNEAPDWLYKLRDGGFKGRLVFEPQKR